MVSIVVGNDLSCTSGNGLVAGHASITINLNGHKLAGNTSSIGVADNGFSTVTIENGTVSGWLAGVIVSGATSKVTGIRATANSNTGIALDATGDTATANVVFKNTGASGIFVDGNNQKATSNVVRENSGQGGILVGGAGDVVQTNQVENAAAYGIDDFGTGNTFIGNVTNGNANDGIRSASDQTATVTTNTANYNGAYGIEASAGGKDGGGNLAKGNTTAAQCKDVICS